MTVKMSEAPYKARAAAMIGLLGLAAGCGETNKYVEPPPPEVTVAKPVTREVTNYFEVTGTAQPLLSVDIRARVRGFLKERLFNEGAFLISRETSGRASTVFADRSATLPKSPVSRHQLTSSCFFRYQSAD